MASVVVDNKGQVPHKKREQAGTMYGDQISACLQKAICGDMKVGKRVTHRTSTKELTLGRFFFLKSSLPLWFIPLSSTLVEIQDESVD